MSDDWHPWQKLKLTDPFECPADWARGWGGRHRPWWIRSWCHFVNIRTPRNAILRFRSTPSVTIESFLYLFASQLTDIIMLFFYILLLLFIVIVEATILNLPFVLQCVMDSFCFVNTKVNGILTHGEICLNDIVVVHFFFLVVWCLSYITNCTFQLKWQVN